MLTQNIKELKQILVTWVLCPQAFLISFLFLLTTIFWEFLWAADHLWHSTYAQSPAISFLPWIHSATLVHKNIQLVKLRKNIHLVKLAKLASAKYCDISLKYNSKVELTTALFKNIENKIFEVCARDRCKLKK